MADDLRDSAGRLVAFHEEAQFAGWSDSHNQGAKITFWLPDSAALEYFRGLTGRKGGQAGQRFYMTLVEIDDDEMPIDQKAREDLAAATKGGPRAQYAGRLCKSPDYHTFLRHLEVIEEGDRNPEAVATLHIYRVCGISSRRELDHDRGAGQRFEQFIRRPFVQWLEG